MTREEFIGVLEDIKGYSYEIEGDKIVITEDDDVYLSLIDEDEELKTLPPGVVFMNNGNVYLESLKTPPPGVEFKNEGDVILNSLETISPGVEFKNGGDVWFLSLETISPGVEFKNVGDVDLGSLIGGEFHKWSGNIEGIDSKKLLNLMIKQGVFI